MTVMVDLNVVVDVLQRREPFFLASASVCDAVAKGKCKAYVSAHGVTTLFYLVRKVLAAANARKAINWLLSTFDIASVDKQCLLRARELVLPDFEDAVVVASAQAIDCSFIVTRNLGDYRNSPVAAVSPEEFLRILDGENL